MLKDSFKKLKQPTKNKQDSIEQPKNLGSATRVILTTLLIFLASQLIAAFIAEAGLAILHPGQHLSLDDSAGGQFIYILIAEGLAAWLVLRIVKRHGLKPDFIGLGRRPNKGDLGKAGIGFAVFFATLIVVGLVINAFWPDLTDQKQNVGFDNLSNNFQYLLAFISLVILPPIGEEILMRGYLYSGLRKVWKFVPSLLITSLLFGAAHLQLGSGTALVWAAAIDTFILSIVLVYLREKTGALYAGMLVHMLNNLLAFLVIIK
ncbi:CPBP family intramembrane metalloprotease [Candidatus Saccharibacteria bacterium]|nr:CPBP family intramembrane metalloprotease [Candidatus Saccharibacteria bacterium]